LDVRAQTTRAAFGELRISQASLAVQGPLDRLTASVKASGAQAGSRITFDAGGLAVTENGRTEASLIVRGDVAGKSLSTRTPARIVIADGRIEAQASLVSGEGGADIVWRGDESGFNASVRFDHADFAPLASLYGARAEGTLTGQARLGSSGAGLSG